MSMALTEEQIERLAKAYNNQGATQAERVWVETSRLVEARGDREAFWSYSYLVVKWMTPNPGSQTVYPFFIITENVQALYDCALDKFTLTEEQVQENFAEGKYNEL